MSREINLKEEQSNKLKKQKRLEFKKIYHKFNPALIFFATRLINDRAAAEDIVAEIFVKYWQKQFDFETVYNVKAFLYISTRNACLNHNDKVNYQSRIRERVQHVTGEMLWSSLNENIYGDVLYLIYTIINELPDKCKKVMQLSFLNGADNGEIAELMNISVHTVRNQKYRGLRLIKDSNTFESVKELWESLYDQKLVAVRITNFLGLPN
jgi:RNA polymerase sigma-70 factor (family 1)